MQSKSPVALITGASKGIGQELARQFGLHGYDLVLTLVAGEPAVLTFTAAVAGRFPMTSHGFAGGGDHSHRPLLYIEVYPD